MNKGDLTSLLLQGLHEVSGFFTMPCYKGSNATEKGKGVR